MTCSADSYCSRVLRGATIALATLILCSCRVPFQTGTPPISREPAGERLPVPFAVAPTRASSPALPQVRQVSYDQPCDTDGGCLNGNGYGAGCVGMEGCPPGPWAPPGLACPWP